MATVVNLPAPAPSQSGEILGRTLGDIMKAARARRMVEKAGKIAQGIKNSKSYDEALELVINSASSGVFEDSDDFNSALKFAQQIHGKDGQESFTAYDLSGNEVKLRVPKDVQITTDEQLRKITGNPNLTISKSEQVEFVMPETGMPAAPARGTVTQQPPGSMTKSQLDALNVVQDNIRAQRELELREREAREGRQEPEWRAKARGVLDLLGKPINDKNIAKAAAIQSQSDIARTVLLNFASGRLENGLFVFDDKDKEQLYFDSIALATEYLWGGTSKTGEQAARAAWKSALGNNPTPEVRPYKSEVTPEPTGLLPLVGKKIKEALGGEKKADSAKPTEDLKGSTWIDSDGITYDYHMIEETAKAHKVTPEFVIDALKKSKGLKRAGSKP